MDAAKMAEFNAQLYMWSAARSGFTNGLSMGTGYELAGPLVGHVSDEVPRELAPSWVPEHDLPELIWDLDGTVRWCAALLDDGQTVVLANDVGGTYIPPGTYLPDNSVVISASSDDAPYWPAYASNFPAESIVLYGQHFGWLERITKMVAGTIPTGCEEPPHKRWVSPFEWARPMMGAHAASVEFIEIDHSGGVAVGRHRQFYDGRSRKSDPSYVLYGSPRRGGRHRLEMIAPHHHARLSESVGGNKASIEAAVLSVAELTVAGARRALKFVDSALTPEIRFRSYSAEVLAVLQVAAAADPTTVAARRLGADAVGCGSVELSESLGLPGYIASEWAKLVDYGYSRLRTVNGSPLPRFEQQAVDQELAGVACRTLLMQALEAIGMWNADPLPVADIEYAARYAAGIW